MRYYYTPFGMVKIHPPTKKKKKNNGPYQTVVRMWSNRNSHSLLVRMQNGTDTLEDSLAISYKSKHTLTIWSSNLALWHVLKWADFLGGPEVRTTLVAQIVKHLPTMWETWVQSLGWKDFLEKEMATHSSILAWKTPWTEETGRLQSMGLQRVGHDWATSLSFKWVENLRSH